MVHSIPPESTGTLNRADTVAPRRQRTPVDSLFIVVIVRKDMPLRSFVSLIDSRSAAITSYDGSHYSCSQPDSIFSWCTLLMS